MPYPLYPISNSKSIFIIEKDKKIIILNNTVFIIACALTMKIYTNCRLLILTLLLCKYRIYPYNKKYKDVLSHRLLMDILLFMDNLIFRYLLLLVVLLYNLLILILKSLSLNLLLLFYLNHLLMDCLLIHWYLRQV